MANAGVNAVKAKKAADNAETEAAAAWDKGQSQYDVTSEVKTGNKRIDPTQYQKLTAGMQAYDPRNGSGMYSGSQQFMQNNAAQGARMANKAYDINEATADATTFDSALDLKNNAAGTYDRALLSGYDGPSQDTKAMTRFQAEKNARDNAAPVGGAASATVSKYIQDQFDGAVDEAKTKYVQQHVATKAAELEAATDRLSAVKTKIKEDNARAAAQSKQAVMDALPSSTPQLNPEAYSALYDRDPAAAEKAYKYGKAENAVRTMLSKGLDADFNTLVPAVEQLTGIQISSVSKDSLRKVLEEIISQIPSELKAQPQQQQGPSWL